MHTTAVELPPGVLHALRAVVGPTPTATRITAPAARIPVWRIAGGHTILALKCGFGRDVDREATVLDALHAVDLVPERPLRGSHTVGTWFATPWYQGATTDQHWAPLRERAPERQITRVRALERAVELAAAVAAVHAKGWTHGDLHPAHCIHTPTGVRLIDYACARGPRGAIPDNLVTPRPNGRIDCAAPEIATMMVNRRRPVATPAADVYALAASLRLCWTGEPAVAVRRGYGGRPLSPEQRWKAIADGAPLSRVPGDLAWTALDDILTPALSRAPMDRPTATELHTQLADLHRAAARVAHRRADTVAPAETTR
ncbi:phosphotransferase [Embleya sp. NPDC059259]|uniref:phosphotransferase n=1 Tax=unclassified Embleya TaxID=2699296 RepID=UPI00367FB634